MLLLKYVFLSILRVAHKVLILAACLLMLFFSHLMAQFIFSYYPELPGGITVWTIIVSLLLIYGYLKIQQIIESYLAKSPWEIVRQPDAFFQLREGTTRGFLFKNSLMPINSGQDNVFMILPMAGLLALVVLPVAFYLRGEYGLLEKALTFISIPFFLQVGITTSYLFDLHKAHKI